MAQQCQGIRFTLLVSWASLVVQLVKNPPAMRKTWVRSLGWEDPLEKVKATPSNILAWRIPWLYSPWGRKESDTTERLSLSKSPPTGGAYWVSEDTTHGRREA